MRKIGKQVRKIEKQVRKIGKNRKTGAKNRKTGAKNWEFFICFDQKIYGLEGFGKIALRMIGDLLSAHNSFHAIIL